MPISSAQERFRPGYKVTLVRGGSDSVAWADNASRPACLCRGQGATRGFAHAVSRFSAQSDTLVGQSKVPLPRILNRPNENGRSQGSPESIEPPPRATGIACRRLPWVPSRPLFTLGGLCGRPDYLLAERATDTKPGELRRSIAANSLFHPREASWIRDRAGTLVRGTT